MSDRDPALDGEWVAVATAPGGDPGRTLQPIYDVLDAAGIPVGFDPYRPGDASNPYPSPGRLFKVVVPASLRDEALDVIRAADLAVPGQPRSDAPASSPFERDFTHSDRVLEDDLRSARADRARRVLALVLVIVLVAAVAFTLYATLANVFETLPPAVP